MSAHTPGPWTRHGLIIAAADGSSVGEMSAGHPYISLGEQERNAALAAAAPDLLVALEAMLNASMYRNHPGESDLAIAAIKKARGS